MLFGLTRSELRSEFLAHERRMVGSSYETKHEIKRVIDHKREISRVPIQEDFDIADVKTIRETKYEIKEVLIPKTHYLLFRKTIRHSWNKYKDENSREEISNMFVKELTYHEYLDYQYEIDRGNY